MQLHPYRNVFDTNEFLPKGGEAVRNIETLQAAFGGSTSAVKVLIEAEITEDRTIETSWILLSLLRRPAPSRGRDGRHPVLAGILLIDWITDDGSSGDKYDPQLREMVEAADAFRLDPQQIQAAIDRLEELDPRGLGQVAVTTPMARTCCCSSSSAHGRPGGGPSVCSKTLYGLWFGRDEELTATSGEIISLEVVNTMTSSQTTSIITTVLAALIILSLFFWITEGRPALGFIAVAPIVMVLLWVLGTMALLGIPYNVITALITALSIGIGVDYTIHIIHRYEEEFAHSRDPEAAARRTLGTTGSALLGSVLTTALGFGVLILSSLTPFQQFGLVTAITIAYALIAAVVVVPPAMILWAAYQNYRLQSAAARAKRELPNTP